ncbi:flagellar biosynthetic protein FliO [Crassaminicella thermophila]|uniref:Flagellar biosynthetic protein FliO n=1 Tax=Crassaminicella thermophila TaxID=2599308 RepID=A0A5C0SCF9_CRATE|nr:flagellar biosynthetic protein FliO [Crassaminicella thermophila]QEK12263.1 flagellar biosynthetic protein FliO [Crassaminicella thermophila]
MKGEIVIIPDTQYYISVIGVFFFILILAYIVTKLIAKNGAVLIKGKNIKIIEKIPLGIDKSIYLINIGTVYYVIAVGKQSIELIDKVNEDSIKLNIKSTQLEKSNDTFDVYLDKYIEEASINKVSIMNKLKKMRRKNEYYKDKDEKK